jgi:hypothetical protein
LSVPSGQLLLYEFGSDTRFEGGILGAIERIEAGDAIRVRDALFVATDAETGELSAVDLRGDGAADLLLFRLDAAERRRVTERTLRRGTGVPGDTIRELARSLEPGRAIVAILLEHRWAAALGDAVSQTGGTALVSELVDAAALDDLTPHLLAAASQERRV